MIELKRIRSQFQMKETFILRDFLALERTTLANERTLFSYVQFSLYLTLAGIGILQLKDFDTIKWLAYVLFSISFFLLIFGILRYQLLQKKLNKLYEDLTNEQISQTHIKQEDRTNKSSKL